MAVNKQPLFTGTIRLESLTFDPPILTSHYDMQNTWSNAPTAVFTATSDYGDIVDRITISSTGDLSNTTINAKLIYIYVGVYNGTTYAYSLYKTLAIPATTITDTTPNPEVELVMQGGLLLAKDDQILIGASTNSGITGQQGDRLSVTVEGGNYTAP